MVTATGPGAVSERPPSAVRNNVGTDGAAGTGGGGLAVSTAVVSGVAGSVSTALPLVVGPDLVEDPTAVDPDDGAEEVPGCCPALTAAPDTLLGEAQPTSAMTAVTAARVPRRAVATRVLIGASRPGPNQERATKKREQTSTADQGRISPREHRR
jgi:hypothetical protein